MEFQTQAQQDCYDKIAPWMKELFGAFMTAREDAPVFTVMVGSALVHVGVSPWGKDDASITTRAYVVMQVEMAQDLMHTLLRANDDYRFGAFGLDKDDDIFFEHTIVGSTSDKEEIKASVMAVVLTADDMDDKIVAKWGGQRALDQMR